MAEAAEVIRTHLAKYSNDPEWIDGDEILTSGVMSSLGAMELVAFLESTFSLQLGDEDLEIENFNSVDGMVALIDRKA